LSISLKYPIIRFAKGEFEEYGYQHILYGHICRLHWVGLFMAVGGKRYAEVLCKRSEKRVSDGVYASFLIP